DRDGAGRAAVRGAPSGAGDPGSPVRHNQMHPGLTGRVPEAREVGVAASARREEELTTPAVREEAGRREERSGDESLQTPAAAFEAEIGAATRDGSAGPLPREGRGEGYGAGAKEAVVAHSGDAEVDGPGGLRDGGANGQQGRCRGEGRGPEMARGRRWPHRVRGGRGAAGGPPLGEDRLRRPGVQRCCAGAELGR